MKTLLAVLLLMAASLAAQEAPCMSPRDRKIPVRRELPDAPQPQNNVYKAAACEQVSNQPKCSLLRPPEPPLPLPQKRGFKTVGPLGMTIAADGDMYMTFHRRKPLRFPF